MRTYYAHKAENGAMQTVQEHLSGTAERAQAMSLPAFAEIAFAAGMLHDVGKFSDAFQRRINGADVRVEHAICGAQECQRLWESDLFTPLMEYCIAGHHSGLPDGGTDADLEDLPTLGARLRRKTEDFSAYQNEVCVKKPDTSEPEQALRAMKSREDRFELYAFFTRYVFSCLTDADFLDTERFCNGEVSRGLTGDFHGALAAVNQKLSSFAADTPVKKARAQLLAQAVQHAKAPSRISLLNMPTGSGKTLCSLKIALEKVLREGKKRIIYVIPYTSIIEQTAANFTGVIGEYVTVLQHHSNFSFDQLEQDDEPTADKLRRTCENWDAPLIVTTSVQFFQSMYHYRSSRLRKLHNMADAVILFDEIHLIPLPYLQPCLRAVGFLTEHFHSSAIFLSATMPDYSDLFSRYLQGQPAAELITDSSAFSAFQTCRYESLHKTSLEAVAQKAADYESSLIVVNSRKTAREMYSLLSGKKFHLSTYMTPEHRSQVINAIRECLKRHETISVVSTSLVEAGVDLDFETVFRQLAGLDSILQAGGRCNREGMRANSTVFIFETDERPHGDLQIRANITAQMLESGRDIDSAESIRDYYDRLFGFHREKIEQNSIAKHCKSIASIPFRTYAEGFDYISSDTVGIVINRNEACQALLQRLEHGGGSARRGLQKYTVPVHFYELEQMQKQGLLQEVGGVYVLSSNVYYEESFGLNYEKCMDAQCIV